MTRRRVRLSTTAAIALACGCAANDGPPVAPSTDDDAVAASDIAFSPPGGDAPTPAELGCEPSCLDRDCGNDGCGGSCGECGAGTVCEGATCVEPPCEPDCAGVACGPDPVCGEACGECDEGFACKGAACVEAKPGLPVAKMTQTAIARRTEGITVDGALPFEEWSESVPFTVNAEAAAALGGTIWGVGGPEDLDAQVALLWDDTNLYLAAEVIDDANNVQAAAPGEWWWDDSVSLFFDLDHGGAGSAWKDGDNAFSISIQSPDPAIWWRQGHDTGAEEKPAGPGAQAVVVFTETGYVLEAAIPLTDLSENIGYRLAVKAGFSVLVADPDEVAACDDSPCQLMWVGAGDDQATWGELFFEGFEDADLDGYGSWIDCEDEASWAHPGGEEIPGNGTDDDCDGQVDAAPDCPEGEKGCGTGCCVEGEGCAAGACCAKDCSGKACGPDGCGGTCGSCAVGITCTIDGKCKTGMSVWPAVSEGGPTGAAWPDLPDYGSGGVAPAPPAGPRTIFQTNAHYQGALAVRADQVLVHRHSHDGGDISAGLASWKAHGYGVGRMFFVGSDAGLEFAGDLGHPEVERDKDGDPIEVDGRPYMVPGGGWSQWVEEITQLSIDGGAATIYPEEPLLHLSGGWSPRFKDAWQSFYGGGWKPPSASTPSSWKGSKLKAELYYQLIADLADYTAAAGGGQVQTVLPVHSLLSFTSGKMVFPHGRAFGHPLIQGMIGQVWTWPVKSLLDDQHVACSTVPAAHTDCQMFESALLLYSYFANLARGSGKSMYFPATPVKPGAGCRSERRATSTCSEAPSTRSRLTRPARN